MSDDLTRLTDEEREQITDSWSYPTGGGGYFYDPMADDGDRVFAAVESILAARTAALIDRAERAERERDGLADQLGAERMAFALEVRAHRRLRAAVTGLADEWANRVDDAYDYGLQLRALVPDEGGNQ